MEMAITIKWEDVKIEDAVRLMERYKGYVDGDRREIVLI